MKIAIGSDHRGFEQKEFIQKNLVISQREWIDVGCTSSARCDYPEFAQRVAQIIQNGQADMGVLLCGTGVGMSIAANRFKGIYAGLAWNETIAKLNKEHDKVNVLVLPSDFISSEQAVAMITVWITAEFSGGRYQKRIDVIDSFGGV